MDGGYGGITGCSESGIKASGVGFDDREIGAGLIASSAASAWRWCGVIV